MNRHSSTLELVNNDVTARAPERDYDATAFELDASALAPQTAPDTTPQVFYDTTLAEVHEESGKERSSSHLSTKPALKWPWMIIALIVAAVVATAVGVGIWRHREHSSHNSSTVTSPPAPHNILNDTSLAAVSLINGDRQVFFQDNTGLIRRAIHSTLDSQWSTSLYLNASTDSRVNSSTNPKSHTPLAVTVFGESYYSVSPGIGLYYVSQSHSLQSVRLYNSDQFWSLDSTLGTYSTAVETRSLSITSLGNGSSDTNSTTNLALLYYENPTGNASALLQRISPRSALAQWVDITSQESQSLPGEFRNTGPITNLDLSHTLYESDNINATFSTPFTSVANFTGILNEDDIGVQPGMGALSPVGALFYSPPNASLVSIVYNAVLGAPGNFSTEIEYPQNYSLIRQSDIATFGSRNFAMWINGTQPVLCLNPVNRAGATLPDNAFPFARLASVTLADQSTTFLYHQINGTTIAEEQWDDSLKVWLPSVYITVSDS